jgi:hypothetical protein
MKSACQRCEGQPGCSRSLPGFTLLEVLIAMGIFFMAVFAILDATNQALRAARSLQVNLPDASAFAANLYLTNRLEEGRTALNFEDVYEANLYPGFTCERDIFLVGTNGLFQVDFVIAGVSAGRPVVLTNTLLLWRPQSASAIPGLSRGR